MSKICPNCGRELDEKLIFCPFCSAFAGNDSEAAQKSLLTLRNIIFTALALALLAGALLAVFVFDIFGMYDNKISDELKGTGTALFSMELTPVCINDRWGYMNKQGEAVIAPEFTAAYGFSEGLNGLGVIRDGEMYGLIDSTGEIQTNSVFLSLGQFGNNGLAYAQSSEGWGYIDSAGRFKGCGGETSYAGDYNSDGYALLISENAHNITCSRIIDSSGNTVVSGDGFAISELDGTLYVSYQTDSTPRKYTLRSVRDGQKLTDSYDIIYFSNSHVLLCSFDENYMYSISIADRTGSIIKDGYYAGRSFSADPSGMVLYKKTDSGYYGVLLDDTLNEIYTCDSSSEIISGFDKSGYACIKRNGRYYAYTVNGEQFSVDTPFGKFNCGLAPFISNKNGKIGYIDTEGQAVAEAVYDGASEFFADGYAYVLKDGKYSVIDTTNSIVIDNLSYAYNKQYNHSTDIMWYSPSDFDGYEEQSYLFSGNTVMAAQNNYTHVSFGEFIPDYAFYKSGTQRIDIPDGGYRVLRDFDISGDGYALVCTNENYKCLLIDQNGNKKLELGSPSSLNSGYNKSICRLNKHYFYNTDLSKDARDDMLLLDRFGCKTSDINCASRELVAADNDFLIIGDKSDKNNLCCLVYTTDMQLLHSFRVHSYVNGKVMLNNGRIIYYRYGGSWADYPVMVDAYSGNILLTGVDGSTMQFIDNGFVSITYSNNEVTYYSKYFKKMPSASENTINTGRYMLTKSDGKYTYYDEFGKACGSYDYAVPFNNSGYAAVKLPNGKYACIDENLQAVFMSDIEILPPCNGYAPYFDKKTGLIGYTDMTGKIVISAQYKCVSDFTVDGYAVVKDKYCLAYAIDKTGKTIISPDAANEALPFIQLANSADSSYSAYSFSSAIEYYTDSTDNYDDALFKFGLAPLGIQNSSGLTHYYVDKFGNRILSSSKKDDLHGYHQSSFARLADGTIAATVDDIDNNIALIGLDGKKIVYPEEYDFKHYPTRAYTYHAKTPRRLQIITAGAGRKIYFKG